MFQKILTRGSEELHLRIAFCGTPTFAGHLPTIASKAKYKTAIHNSAKCFSSYEKMKKISNLATKTLFNKKIKKTIISYKMNPILFYYYRKIEQKLYTANWQNYFEAKTKRDHKELKPREAREHVLQEPRETLEHIEHIAPEAQEHARHETREAREHVRHESM